MNRQLLLFLMLSAALLAQNITAEKPCIAFSPESDSPTNEFAKDPLQTAVMQSGDFDFYPSRRDRCWNVHVLTLPINSSKGKRIGYAISNTVTDPKSLEVGHALAFGPDQIIFTQAMRRAVADAIRNIRLARSAVQSPQ